MPPLTTYDTWRSPFYRNAPYPAPVPAKPQWETRSFERERSWRSYHDRTSNRDWNTNDPRNQQFQPRTTWQRWTPGDDGWNGRGRQQERGRSRSPSSVSFRNDWERGGKSRELGRSREKGRSRSGSVTIEEDWGRGRGRGRERARIRDRSMSSFSTRSHSRSRSRSFSLTPSRCRSRTRSRSPSRNRLRSLSQSSSRSRSPNPSRGLSRPPSPPLSQVPPPPPTPDVKKVPTDLRSRAEEGEIVDENSGFGRPIASRPETPPLSVVSPNHRRLLGDPRLRAKAERERKEQAKKPHQPFWYEPKPYFIPPECQPVQYKEGSPASQGQITHTYPPRIVSSPHVPILSPYLHAPRSQIPSPFPAVQNNLIPFPPCTCRTPLQPTLPPPAYNQFRDNCTNHPVRQLPPPPSVPRAMSRTSSTSSVSERLKSTFPPTQARAKPNPLNEALRRVVHSPPPELSNVNYPRATIRNSFFAPPTDKNQGLQPSPSDISFQGVEMDLDQDASPPRWEVEDDPVFDSPATSIIDLTMDNSTPPPEDLI